MICQQGKLWFKKHLLPCTLHSVACLWHNVVGFPETFMHTVSSPHLNAECELSTVALETA